MTIDSVSEKNKGVFTCRITNDAGSVESDAAQLYVTAPPKVTRHPVSQTTNPGKSVTFSVSASGTPPLSFQWLKDGTMIDGQTSETFTIHSVSENDEGVFSCRITNDAGSVESDAAQLYVTAPPEVTRHPMSQTINPGKSVTFSVSASGDPPLSFQWLKDGKQIKEQTAEILTIDSVSEKNKGVFSCRITNAAGSVESDAAQLSVTAPPDDISAKAKLIVQLPPEVTRHPASQTINPGKSVTFSVSASGTPPLSFQWKKDGIDIAGATADNFTIASAQKDDEGVYTCEVRNDFSHVVSSAARLVIETPAPEISENIASLDHQLKQKPPLAIRNLFLAAPDGQGQYAHNGNILTITGSATSPAILVSAHLEDNQERFIRDISKGIQIDPDTFDIKGSVFVGSFRGADAVLLKLVVRDPEDSRSAENKSNLVFVDNNSPEVQITEPTNNSSFKTSPILIRGTASDDLSGIVSVEISTDGGLTYCRVDSFKDGHWDYSFRPATARTAYNIYARATDKAGLSSISDYLTINYIRSQPAAPKAAKTNKNIPQGNLSQNKNKSPDDIGICTYRVTDLEHSRFQPTELFSLKEDMAIIVKGYGGNVITIKIISSSSGEVLFELVDYIPENKHKIWRWKLSSTGSFQAVLFVDGTQKDNVYFKIVQ